ncbi:MAG: hypothetical protein ABJA67_02885 [Chthonomonadales bacterium]
MSSTEPIFRLPADLNVKLIHARDINLPTAALALDTHSGGKRLYAGCMDRCVYEVDLATGAKTLIGKHESYVSGVRYLPALRQVVTAGYDGTIKWFDAANHKEILKVDAHKFWSWKMRVSPDQKYVGTVTGQYMAGGIKYEPAAEREPSVKVYEAESGKLKWSFPHIPPTQSVAFSPDSKHIAAGNLMGEVRIWNLETGRQVATFTTPDFTCWGIIKSHLYIGGIFDMTFSPDGKDLLVCGMGPMVDPMAGNGKQTWQRFAWTENPLKMVSQIRVGDAGAGLMETINFHPDSNAFIMAGKLAQGKWNTALFDAANGQMVHSVDAKMRVTDSVWLGGGAQLALSGATGQGKKSDGKYPEFGHIKLYDVKPQA